MRLFVKIREIIYGHLKKHFRDDTFNNSGILFFNCFDRPNYSGAFMNTIYGIHGEDKVFNTLEDAENYLIEHYPEFCGGKDATYDFCENMIWEEVA
jgi:hypothetical protein